MRQSSRYLVMLLGIAVTGCEVEDPIRTYTVPKHDLIQLDVAAAEQSPAPSGDPTDRMLAAIVMKGERAWFFKGTGPSASFSATDRTRFDQFLTSLRFAETDSDKPSWELPEGWTENAATGMRLANLRMGNGVEISVIPLPLPPNDERGYLLSNVNRWRNQLRLGPLSSSELARETYQLKTADGTGATVADFQGWLDESSLPPMARSSASRPGASASQSPVAAPPASNAAPFTFTVPDGWEEQPASGMRSAVFTIRAGNEQAEVTVIALGGAAGGVLENVNRWRGQIGLPALASAEELEVETVRIDGQDATLVQLDGKESQSIVAALYPRDGQVWFIKLTGTTTIAKNQQQAFRQFLVSFKFR